MNITVDGTVVSATLKHYQYSTWSGSRLPILSNVPVVISNQVTVSTKVRYKYHKILQYNTSGISNIFISNPGVEC